MPYIAMHGVGLHATHSGLQCASRPVACLVPALGCDTGRVYMFQAQVARSDGVPTCDEGHLVGELEALQDEVVPHAFCHHICLCCSHRPAGTLGPQPWLST